ncbi:MAG: PAS domain S-box protein [Patescibacteria group bacterium]
MKNRTIKQKLVKTIIVIGFVFGAVSVTGSYFYLQNFLTKDRVEYVLRIAREQAGETNAEFDYYRLFSKMLGTNTVLEQYLTEPSDEHRMVVDGLLNKYAITDKNILSIYVLDKSGLTLVSTDKTFIGNNYGFRDYFQSAIRGNPLVTSAIGVTTNQFGYYFSYPIQQANNDAIGVVVIKVSDDYINNKLYEGELVKGNTLMLVDGDSVVMASSRPERILSSLGPLTALERTKVIQDNKFNGHKIETLQYGAVKDIITNYQAPQSIKIMDEIDGEEEVVYIEKLKDIPYYLVTEIGMEDVVQSVGLTTAGVSIVIALGFLIFFLISYRIVRVFLLRPIKMFTDNINEISTGNFSSRVNINTGDEWESLANTINTMSAKIENYYSDLNIEINVKTKELKINNKKLEEQQMAILNILDDVEREKEKSTKLAEELQKFKLAVDNASDYIIITDPEGTVLYVNKAVERVTGYTPKEVINKKAGTLWHSPMPQKFYEKFWDTIKNKKKVFIGELTNKRKNGELYQAEISIAPILDDNTDIKFYLGIERDISERKIAEKQINQTLKELAADKAKDEALFANIADGIVSTNQDGIITMINDSALNMLGYSKQELMGRPVTTMFKLVYENDEMVSLQERPMMLALTNGTKTKTPIGTVYYYKRKDGTKFPVNIIVTPFILNGKIVGVIEVFRDVTLETNVDRMKTEFVSLASHQLRTPLSAVNWYAEMLLTGDAGKLKPQQKEFVDEIYKGNHRMVELVNALLNVSRIELGVFAVEPEMADLKEITETIFDELKPAIKQKKMKVTKQYDAALGKISLDTKLFRIVLQNILTNAVKYTAEKGRINLIMKKRARDILFSVTDNGYGIPQKDQSKIFTKMFRADNVQTKDTSGTGLGLYIAKAIVEQTCHGKIWFESKENKGTTFYFTIPLAGMLKKTGNKALA